MKNSVNSTPRAGYVIVILLLLFVGATIYALLSHSSGMNITLIWSDPYFRYITQFSFFQALLSTLLTLVFAIPTAYALSRRQFLGRSLMLKLCATTLVLPVLVGVFGLLAIYGNSGLFASLFNAFDSELPFSIYGLNGILLAHLFFNYPFATRLFLQSLDSISLKNHQLAAHLGLTGWHKFRLLAWPRIKQQLPKVAGLIFMLCFTSFSVVMVLGDGPKSTTIELAIYQAIKFDFDLQTGAMLALWQMLLCGALSLLIQRFSNTIAVDSTTFTSPTLYQDSRAEKIWDSIWIIVLIVFIVPPLLMIIISGLNPEIKQVLTTLSFWQALGNSLLIALFAALFAMVLGILLLQTTRALRLNQKAHLADKMDLIGTIILITPSLVISTGLFLLLRRVTELSAVAFWVVIAVNSLMVLPYVIKTLAQPLLHIAQQYQLLCSSLGINGLHRFWLIDWRGLNKPMIHAFSIAYALSIGDFSVIALFGSQEFTTLPFYLFQLLGSYQMEAAAVVSLVLLTLSLGIFAIVEWISSHFFSHRISS